MTAPSSFLPPVNSPLLSLSSQNLDSLESPFKLKGVFISPILSAAYQVFDTLPPSLPQSPLQLPPVLPQAAAALPFHQLRTPQPRRQILPPATPQSLIPPSHIRSQLAHHLKKEPIEKYTQKLVDQDPENSSLTESYRNVLKAFPNYDQDENLFDLIVSIFDQNCVKRDQENRAKLIDILLNCAPSEMSLKKLYLVLLKTESVSTNHVIIESLINATYPSEEISKLFDLLSYCSDEKWDLVIYELHLAGFYFSLCLKQTHQVMKTQRCYRPFINQVVALYTKIYKSYLAEAQTAKLLENLIILLGLVSDYHLKSLSNKNDCPELILRLLMRMEQLSCFLQDVSHLDKKTLASPNLILILHLFYDLNSKQRNDPTYLAKAITKNEKSQVKKLTLEDNSVTAASVNKNSVKTIHYR